MFRVLPFLAAAFGSLALLITSFVLSHVLGFDLVWPLVMLTAAWAAWDSRRIDLVSYRTGISLEPMVLFASLVPMWIAGFPWYLYKRYEIKRGLLRPVAVPVAPSP